jgi:lysozyme family protein
MTRDEAAGEILRRVLEREGGIGDADDGEGVTYFGQTETWLTSFGFEAPKTSDEAIANYRTWLVRTRLIEVCDYADSLADNVIDWAVHSGHPIAVRHLQAAMSVRGDGILGPETADAIGRCDRPRAARRVLAARERFIAQLTHRNPAKYVKFAADWGNRLAGLIEMLD